MTAPGLTLAYSGDAGPDPALSQLAADADLFIAGATFRSTTAESGDPYPMSAVDAGTWATRAGAKRLMLTHFWPGSDRARSTADARSSFSGEVIAAAEHMAFTFWYSGVTSRSVRSRLRTDSSGSIGDMPDLFAGIQKFTENHGF
ncbi:MBL fold metallo-hydrolase [Kitasatospora sp. NPDC056138]|uniref:MBL fold metallo-hydrolase n=1 Tax=Kitasatospora sp. NPDC056138 TaxID=3345724 RepID=UPI0035E05323